LSESATFFASDETVCAERDNVIKPESIYVKIFFMPDSIWYYFYAFVIE
jgi:hypothetical protein